MCGIPDYRIRLHTNNGCFNKVWPYNHECEKYELDTYLQEKEVLEFWNQRLQ